VALANRAIASPVVVFLFLFMLASLVGRKVELSLGGGGGGGDPQTPLLLLFFLRLASLVGTKVELSSGVTPQTPLISVRSGLRISVLLDARFARWKESRAFLGADPPRPPWSRFARWHESRAFLGADPQTPLVSLRSGRRISVPPHAHFARGRKVELSRGATPQTPLVSLRSGLRMSPQVTLRLASHSLGRKSYFPGGWSPLVSLPSGLAEYSKAFNCHVLFGAAREERAIRSKSSSPGRDPQNPGHASLGHSKLMIS
jgi:hypothetical protein